MATDQLALISSGFFSGYGTRDVVGHRKKVYSLGWNCTGKKLASGSWDQTIRIWTIEPYHAPQGSRSGDKCDAELKGHQESVDTLCWDPIHDYRLATTSSDKTVKIWDIRSGGKCSSAFTTPAANIYLAWHPDGNMLAVGNRQDQVAFLDLKKNKFTKAHKNPYQVNEIAWTRNGKYFIQTTGNGSVEIWKWPELELVRTVTGHSSPAYAVALDPEERYMASGGSDGVACLWDVCSMAAVRCYYRMDVPIRSLHFSFDSRYLAICPEEGPIEIEDVESGELAARIPINKTFPETVRWNPRHNVLAYTSDAGDNFGAVGIFAPPRPS